MTTLFTGNFAADTIGGEDSTAVADAFDPAFVPSAVRKNFFRFSSELFEISWSAFRPASVLSDLWSHFTIYRDGNQLGDGDGNTPFLYFSDDQGRIVGGILMGGPAGQYRAFVADSETTNPIGSIGNTGAFYAPTNNLRQTYDIRCRVDASTIEVDVYLGGILVSSATGPRFNQNGAQTQTITHFDVTSSNGEQFNYYSELLMRENVPTIGNRLSLLTPDADGFYSQFSGNFAGVQNRGDGLTVASFTPDDRQSWSVTDYGGPTGSVNVAAVVGKQFPQAGNLGPQNFAPFLRIAGVDYTEAAEAPSLAGNYTEYTVNPATGLAWTTAELVGLEQGAQSKA